MREPTAAAAARRVTRALVTSVVIALALVCLLIAPASARAQPGAAPVVYVADVDATIQPVSAEYMVDVIDRADQARAALVVFLLQTPGGLLDSTRTIVERMLRAATPIVVFVAPPGARAASAGFIITLAADVAAMAPGTHMGAAHPVSADGQRMDDTMARKAAEDVAAFARTLAAGRQRNVTLAMEAVASSRAFTEQEAIAASPPLIDVVAADVPALLRTLHGRTVRRFDGSSAVLDTAAADVVRVPMTRRQRILSVIAHPTVAYLLLSLGMLGLMIELWSPGAIVPGVVGAASLLLAFFALQLLPVNYAGLLFILLGLLLLGLEIKVTSYGLLTVSGAASLVFGSMMLMDRSVPDLRLPLGFVIPVVAGIAGVGALLVRLGVAAQREPATTGAAGMIGLIGRTLSEVTPGHPGRVAVHGESWRATADEHIDAGTRVRVTGVDGLTVTIRAE